jgi:DNA-binding transcriptional regulator YhcF (GntR family)
MAARKRTGRGRVSGVVKHNIRKAVSGSSDHDLTVVDNERDDETLTDRAYRQIEELIVTLALPPETILSEQSLAQRLGIGRTPIREALQRLARDGLVVILPRRGILVSQINLKTQMRLLEVRRELERLMARGAAERATAAETARFAGIARDMRRASDQADDMTFMRLDRALNDLVSDAWAVAPVLVSTLPGSRRPAFVRAFACGSGRGDRRARCGRRRQGLGPSYRLHRKFCAQDHRNLAGSRLGQTRYGQKTTTVRIAAPRLSASKPSLI